MSKDDDQNDETNIIEGYDTTETLMTFFDALMTSSRNLTEEWILDSKCTFHMTHNKVWVQNF